MKKFKVKVVVTTDDPTDDLKYHAAIARSGLETKVVPTFRPDRALNLHQTAAWNAWVDKLAAAADMDIRSLDALLDALKRRHDFFAKLGGRMTDHGLEQAFAEFAPQAFPTFSTPSPGPHIRYTPGQVGSC